MTESTTGPSTTSSGTSGDVRAQADVRAAVEDYARRRGVPADAVSVVSLDEVMWRDSSLGCPEPGMQYAKVLVQGRRLVLSAGGQEGSYHGGRTGALSYCATPTRPAAGGAATSAS